MARHGRNKSALIESGKDGLTKALTILFAELRRIRVERPDSIYEPGLTYAANLLIDGREGGINVAGMRAEREYRG